MAASLWAGVRGNEHAIHVKQLLTLFLVPGERRVMPLAISQVGARRLTAAPTTIVDAQSTILQEELRPWHTDAGRLLSRLEPEGHGVVGELERALRHDLFAPLGDVMASP